MGWVMKNKRRIIHTLTTGLFIITVLLLAPACQQGGGDIGMTITKAINNVREWFIMNGANDRIEKLRKGDAVITVVDSAGTPVRDARIHFEQQSHEFLFGSNLQPLAQKGPNEVNPEWAEAYVALFNYGTLPCYWESYETRYGQTEDALLLAMADWAKKRGIVTKGHPLIWAGSVPSWAPIQPEDMQKAQEARVKTIVSKTCGMIDYWDVVNEPTTGPRVTNPLGNWMNVRTPATVCVDALDWARASCPKALLLISDFRTDVDFRDLLQDVIRQRGKFDAIGIQSHMHRGNWPLYQVWDICERFKDFNVPLHFTEVTVISGSPKVGIGESKQPASWPTTPEGELAQADYVEKLYTLLFSHPSVQAITWWDFSDLDAWQGAPAGLLRKDMSKKPAYDRLFQLIHRQWWSRGDVYTNDDGVAVLRGFYGSYKLNIEKEKSHTEVEAYPVVKGVDNKLKIQLSDYQQAPPTPLSEQIWPYIIAAVVVAILGLIINWIIQLRKRI